ncbi:hypothetical protein BDV98DRAFT_608960 [Pterulicium gracile]|uniref:Uncharacterized protein n=1 Tax=Pterulicium gracile TaxID=1884261 RepID=A0A5C3Q0T7_9AGAR|nr:hypothetical protein BDV98DRAFT_608960 [Pterula gracilis]
MHVEDVRVELSTALQRIFRAVDPELKGWDIGLFTNLSELSLGASTGPLSGASSMNVMAGICIIMPQLRSVRCWGSSALTYGLDVFAPPQLEELQFFNYRDLGRDVQWSNSVCGFLDASQSRIRALVVGFTPSFPNMVNLHALLRDNPRMWDSLRTLKIKVQEERAAITTAGESLTLPV